MVPLRWYISIGSGDFIETEKVGDKGSWWVDWIKWIKSRSRKKVPARLPGDGELAPICDAPGDYVRVRY